MVEKTVDIRELRALGYAGHKTAKETLAPTLKPGDSFASLSAKYKNISEDVDPHEKEKLHYKTISTIESTRFTTKDYKVPSKKGMMAGQDQPYDPKPFLHTSVFKDDQRPVTYESRAFAAIDEESLRRAFSKVDPENKGLVDTRKIPEVLQPFLTPKWILEKFKGHFAKFAKRRDGRMDVDEWISSVQAVKEYIVDETSCIPVGYPEWIKQSKKAPVKVVTSLNAKPSYILDFGDPSLGKQDWPMSRKYTFKNTMKGKTLDLAEGTSKHTYNLPGYGGHVPTSLRLAKQKLHAENVIPRKPHNDLLLTYHNNMPGYTGYFPCYAMEASEPRDLGACSQTSSGAAVLGLML